MTKDKIEDKDTKNTSNQETKQEAVSNFYAQGDVTIGDIKQTINQYIQKNEIEFLKRTNLKEFQHPYFPQINRIDELVRHIKENSILVLGGNHADKPDIAWHLTAHLQLSIQNSSIVYEWESTSDRKGIIEAIRKEINDGLTQAKESTKIFVLLNLAPHDVNLETLQKFSRGKNIFVIVSTETPQEKWRLNQLERKLWLDSTDLSYKLEFLSQAAIERIPEGIAINTEMKQKLRKLVAEQLNTVAGVNICIDWLRNCKHNISSDDLDKAIQSAKEDKKERLKKWFRALTAREQLLAIGITLFNGLYTDQFFAALERVVEQVWQKRDPSLQALDHCDLESLGNFCEFSEVIKGDDFVLRRLNVKDPESGKLLLGIAWESHRRQIITALEEIVRIVQNSAQDKLYQPSDWQIYGNSPLRERLYEGVSESFANVGLIAVDSTSPVQNFLLALASDSNFIVQNFAATILADWYKNDTGKFIRTLDFFYNITIENQLNHQDTDPVGPYNRIGATVALAISHASLNDIPHHLYPPLCDWLTTLSNSKNSLIRVYFGLHTLAYVVPRHLHQIHPILKKIAENQPHLGSAIAQSLASAYKNYPDKVLEYLEDWTQNNPNNALLCTIARTYGFIDCTVRPQFAFEKLQSFLKREKHPTVRKAVIEGMSNQLKQNCALIGPLMPVQFSKFNKAERNRFVAHLTEIYLAQRAKLTGGEGYCEVDNKTRYRIWIDTKRPLTDVEIVLLQWLGQTQSRTAQQIATQAAIEFAKALDMGEESEINRLQKLKSLTAHAEIANQDLSDPWNENWLAPIVAWVATLREKVYQPVVQNILPEAIVHHRDYRAGMDFVLRKWEQALNQSIGYDHRLKLSLTATSLRRGLGAIDWVIDNRKPLIICGGVSLLGLMTLHTVMQKTPSQQATKNMPGSSGIRVIPPQPEELPRAIDEGISISDAVGVSDVDSPNFDKGELKVSFTANATPNDQLSILNEGKGPGKIEIADNQVLYGGKNIGSFTSGNGEKPLIVALNADATLEATEALLQNISYKNNSEIVASASRTVQFVLSDGKGGVSDPLTRTISLVAKNQAPAISAPETLPIRENSSLNYGKIDINDPDSQMVTVQLSVNNGLLSVKENIPKGVKPEEISNNNTKSINLKGSLEKIKTTLVNSAAITYKSNPGFAGDDSLTIKVIDSGPTISDKKASLIWPPGAQKSAETSQSIKIAVTPLNQYPVITLPEPKVVDEDQDLNINGLLIKDPDSKDDKQTIKVTLTTGGSLKINPKILKGLTVKDIKSEPSCKDNNNAQPCKIVLKGAITTINTTLADPAAITYRGKQDFNGSDSLKIQVDDGGRGAEQTLSITVNPVNDPPRLGSASRTITKEEALQLINDYVKAKREIYVPPFPQELAARYTMGKLYEYIAKPGTGQIDELKRKNQYFQFGNQIIQVLDFKILEDKAFISVRAQEELSIFENGRLIVPPQNNPIDYRFELRTEGNRWKIYDREKI
jgi:hypothetical protein